MARFQRDVLGSIALPDGGPSIESWVFRRAPMDDGTPRRRIVVLHGLGDAPVSWFPALRGAFPDAELALPALPGAGRGPLPAGYDHLDFRQTADWTRQVLHHLLDGLPTTFIGHSLGGWLLARALLADPSLAASSQAPILVNNAGTWYEDVERERVLLSPRTLEDVDELTLQMYARPPHLPPEALQAMLHTMRAPSYRGVLDSPVREDFLTERELARLPPGIGLVWGMADGLVPPEAFERLRTHLPSPRVVRLEDAGHAPHIEAPTALIAALDRLLA